MKYVKPRVAGYLRTNFIYILSKLRKCSVAYSNVSRKHISCLRIMMTLVSDDLFAMCFVQLIKHTGCGLKHWMLSRWFCVKIQRMSSCLFHASHEIPETIDSLLWANIIIIHLLNLFSIWYTMDEFVHHLNWFFFHKLITIIPQSLTKSFQWPRWSGNLVETISLDDRGCFLLEFHPFIVVFSSFIRFVFWHWSQKLTLFPTK